MDIQIKVTVKIQGLDRYIAQIHRDLYGSGQGPIRQALDSWANMYLHFLYNRFRAYSLGGGNWATLAPATVRRKYSFVILVDSSTLQKSLHPRSHRTAQREQIPGGIRIRWEGGPHPNSKRSISELMVIHHFGTSHVPARTIIVNPDSALHARLQKKVNTALQRLSQDNDL